MSTVSGTGNYTALMSIPPSIYTSQVLVSTHDYTELQTPGSELQSLRITSISATLVASQCTCIIFTLTIMTPLQYILPSIFHCSSGYNDSPLHCGTGYSGLPAPLQP